MALNGRGFGMLGHDKVFKAAVLAKKQGLHGSSKIWLRGHTI